jgi:hypothetical protein
MWVPFAIFKRYRYRVSIFIYYMYVCMYVCTHMYVYTGPPFQDLGWVGGWVMGTPCIRLVTSQNMGQKLLTKRVGVMMGGVIWLHLRISRAKWKHFMINKT